MRKTRIIAVAMLVMLAIGAVAAWAADDILGLWKIIDDKSGKPNAYVMLYMNGGKLYGRMVATISLDTGLVDDTLATKKFKADALAGDPPNCGLDFVYELQDKGKEWKGSIIDPGDGKVYDCSIKREGSRLTVRGSLKGTGGLFGRNQTWMLASASELPSGFTLPDSRAFVPVIPRKK
ncbi:MAG TPA: DUF2147 domain-containing protein [Spirochaetia bacterium]|nr:DUF2147 domain-containing protein [Spirochaetaceae bacterium]HPE89754.1 DUF2147 domain-containing protein [Spirochaetales bacterium]HRW22857.1 DUF2147 domain-containing protein [Spirochaetia bacterium]